MINKCEDDDNEFSYIRYRVVESIMRQATQSMHPRSLTMGMINMYHCNVRNNRCNEAM